MTLIDDVAAHARSPAVLAAFEEPTGYVHQDLRGENVLVLSKGYRVLDWQRPIWGPLALDRASLLDSFSLDPAGHVSRGVLQLRTLLRIAWDAQCARHWFPPGAATYEREIAQAVTQLEV